jgi:photosystem II stability/assembly factor-like uncharacterized protein
MNLKRSGRTTSPLIIWILSTLFLSTQSFSQTQWVKVNVPTDRWLHSVHFVDGTTGWVVGDQGKIFKTTDRGATWTDQSFSTNLPLSKVQFIDINLGWIAGGAGVTGLILRTTNGGATWTQVRSDTVAFIDMFFVSQNVGWAVGVLGTILKTTDGGLNWVKQPTSTGTEEPLFSVSFTDANNGWVGGGTGVMLKTTNGGTNWDSTGALDVNDYAYSIAFANSTTGWLAASSFSPSGGFTGNVRKSVDAGATWPTNQLALSNEEFYSLDFVDSNYGWAAGTNGLVYQTTNGASWVLSPTSLDVQLSQVFAKAGPGVWVVGVGGTLIKGADKPLQVTVFLEGAYDAAGDTMRTTLRNNSVGNLGSSPARTVDSVRIQLRSAANDTIVIASQTALLRNNGLATNFTPSGSGGTGFPILFFSTVPDGSYYIVVKHRNHLAVRSSSTVSVNSSGTATWNFSTALSQAKSFGTQPGQKQIDSSPLRFGMFAGDADGNGSVQTADIQSFLRLALGRAGYVGSDVSLNGQVQNTDVEFYCRPNIGKTSAIN